MTPDIPAAPEAEWFQTPTLRGQVIFLEGLNESHAAEMCAGADDETVRLLARGGPSAPTTAAWAEYIGRLNALPQRINFAVRLVGSGLTVGRVSYSEIKWADRWAEMGTMLLPAAQGTGVNPEAKLLLMARAFEVLGAGRVHFKVDSRNARSLRAMHKLGAVQEGTLRRYQVRPDGFARDSVIFSVLRGEWPAVKAGLEARLDTLE
ncbi:GNAT family N-acetyltransferase [Deinococcus frigens]|uniref:GNAT family N-acetyltransferase n=1 Tax=Deinococcus frigens TaxID=249403 RepID=UPI0004953A56|nr:GNAT family protein [Deinococcus frigens]